MLELLFFALPTVLMAIDETPMAYCNIYQSTTFVPYMSSSLVEILQLLPSSPPTVAQCALLCLNSILCQTAVLNAQADTCTMYNEVVDITEKLVPASSNAFVTISMSMNIPLSVLIGPGDTVHAVWNVSAGGDSLPASPGSTMGHYYSADSPSNIFDGNLTTDLDSYGACNVTFYGCECGQNTGVYVTANRSPFVLDSFRIATGHYFGGNRDPLTITIEGSNQNGSNLTLGSSWTLIYNGTSGLSPDPGRYSLGTKQMVTNNTLLFASYRFLVVEIRGIDSCAEYAEIQVFGH